MHRTRRSVVLAAVGVVLVVLALSQRAAAQSCPAPCNPCPAGTTCFRCDKFPCHPVPQGPPTFVFRHCCKNSKGHVTCEKFPKCPPVSPS